MVHEHNEGSSDTGTESGCRHWVWGDLKQRDGVFVQECRVCHELRYFVPQSRYNALADASVIAEHGRLEALRE
jgi:hypothetical protein